MYVSIGLHRSEIDKRLVTAYIVKTGEKFYASVQRWNAAVPVFVRFPSAFSVCVRHNQSGYLTFKTTKIKDTKLTLAVIPF